VPADLHRLVAIPALFLGMQPMTDVGLGQRPTVLAREVVPPHPPAVPTRGDVPPYLPAALLRGDDRPHPPRCLPEGTTPLAARGGVTRDEAAAPTSTDEAAAPTSTDAAAAPTSTYEGAALTSADEAAALTSADEVAGPTGAGTPTPTDQRILARRTFRGLASEVAVARRWLAQLVDGFAAVDDVLLASSELASNAVLHSDSGLPGGVYTIRLAISSEYVRVEVLDQGGQWGVPRGHADYTRDLQKGDGQCGRGLAVVAAITRAWGIAGDQQGRIAWCEIESE
jgi:serine/threonine-protein kinase RsbW